MEISAPVALAVLGAALLHATWNALVKSSADKLLDITGVALGAAACALVVAPWVAFPARESWGWLAASAVVHILYFLCVAGAYRFAITRGEPLVMDVDAALYPRREIERRGECRQTSILGRLIGLRDDDVCRGNRRVGRPEAERDVRAHSRGDDEMDLVRRQWLTRAARQQ